MQTHSFAIDVILGAATVTRVQQFDTKSGASYTLPSANSDLQSAQVERKKNVCKSNGVKK